MTDPFLPTGPSTSPPDIDDGPPTCEQCGLELPNCTVSVESAGGGQCVRVNGEIASIEDVRAVMAAMGELVQTFRQQDDEVAHDACPDQWDIAPTCWLCYLDGLCSEGALACEEWKARHRKECPDREEARS